VVSVEALRPELGTVLVAPRVQEKEANVTAAELDVEARNRAGTGFANDLLDSVLKVARFRRLKRDSEELMDYGGVNARDGVAEEDDEDFLGAHIEKGAEGNLGLVRESLGLVEDNDLWSGIYEEGVKGGAYEGIDTTSDGFEAAFVAGVEKEGAAEERGRFGRVCFAAVECLYEEAGGCCLA